MTAEGEAGARRRLLISALEAGSFQFACGCLVAFWANYTSWAGEAAGQDKERAGAILLCTLIVLIVAETAASFLGAALVERLAHRKRFVAVTGLLTHGAWFVFGLAMLFLPAGWLLGLTFALVGWRGFFDGLLIAPWLDLAARVAPAGDRAKFFSIRLFAGALALPLGGLAAGFFFRRFSTDARYYWAAIFMLAGLVASLGDLARLGYEEPPAPVDRRRAGRGFGHDLADYFRLVLRDRRFLRLVGVTAVISLTETLFPNVLALFGKLRLGMPEKEYQQVLLLMQLSPLLAYFALPALVRRLAWRRTYAVLTLHFVVAFGLLAAAARAFPAGALPAAAAFCGALVLAGLARGWGVADANVLYEIAPPEKRPSYLVASRALANAAAVTVMLGLAWLGRRELPYAAIFGGLSGAALVAALALIFIIRTDADREKPPAPAAE